MMQQYTISGFADEICSDFSEQLRVVTALGMHAISLRSANGKSVADYTEPEFMAELWPLLQKAGVEISSIGSPIGKIPLGDAPALARQLEQLEQLCRICRSTGCRYIRIFSFYLEKGADPAAARDQVLAGVRRFLEIAEQYDVILLHENEKDIYGDTGARCLDLYEQFGGEHFRLAFDFANFVQCGEDPEQCWELLHGGVRYIHIKDALYATGENVPVGQGDGKVEKLLARALLQENYHGYLTLEPHLVRFQALSMLEHKTAHEVVLDNKAPDGAHGYALQYRSLCEILDRIGCKGAQA